MRNRLSRWRSLQSTFCPLLLLTFGSCGGYDDNDSSYNPPSPQEEQTQEGTFRTVANTVNPDVASSSGATQIRIQGDQFEAEIFGSGPATTHGQFIHSGTRCPMSSDDTNGDGVIDSSEGAAVYGTRVVSLDSDLSSNAGVFPFAETYSYSQNASLSTMLANLNVPALNVEGKAVTIQGVPDSINLPESVQGLKRDLPIACGILQRVDE